MCIFVAENINYNIEYGKGNISKSFKSSIG